MFDRFRPNRTGIALLPLMLGACAWPQPPDVSPQAVTAQLDLQERVALPKDPPSVPPANAPQVSVDQATTPGQPEASASSCNASKPGQVIGFDEFFAATLKGSEGERLYISAAPGAAPGESYGLAGDEVEAIATALDNNCDAWTWVKWAESDYRGWLPTSSIELERDSGDSDQPTKAKAQRASCSHDCAGLVAGTKEVVA